MDKYKFQITVDYVIYVDDGISILDAQKLVDNKLIPVESGKVVGIEYLGGGDKQDE